MGKLLGGGSKTTTQTSTSESKPWEKAIPYLEKLMQNADKLFDSQGGVNKEFIDKELADLNPEMQSAISNMIESPNFKGLADNITKASQSGLGGIGVGSGVLGDAAQGKLNISSDQINDLAKGLYQGDVVKSQVDQLGKDVNEQLSGQIQGLNQQASAAGGMGSSRAGIAEGVATGKAADAISKGSSDIQNAARMDAYNKAMGIAQGNVGTQMQGAQGAGQLGLGAGQLQSGLGSIYNQMTQNQLQGAGILQNQDQNKLNNQWFNQTGQQNAGWDALGKYLGMMGPVGGMGGTGGQTGTSSGGGQSGFNQLLGLGSTAGGIMQGMGSMGWSDASLKKKVKRTGNKDGVNTYKWEWNDSAGKKLGLKGKAEGVLAQDVAKSKPNVVKRDSESDKLMVDYGALSKELKK